MSGTRMPNASLALNQGGNVAANTTLPKGVTSMPAAKILFYHEKRLSALEKRNPTNNSMSQMMDSQTATAIELLSQRLGKMEELLKQLAETQQQYENAIQLEVEETEDGSEESEN